MFTKDTTINEVVERIPDQAFAIFSSFRMGCIGCAMARHETLGEGCAVHGVDIDEMLEALNTALELA